MNIFVLDRDQQKSAEYHCNKHVVKMITEYAQVLCSSLIINGYPAPYKLTHKNHPCVLWASDSLSNWKWLRNFAICLYDEYKFRYKNRIHKSGEVVLSLPTPDFVDKGLTNFPQVMPDYCKRPDVVDAYRHYYVMEKSGMLHYSNRSVPDWIREYQLMAELSNPSRRKIDV